MADDTFGILVGWTHQMANGRLILSLESVHSLEQSRASELDRRHLHMTLNQAVVLGNFLLATSGNLEPVDRNRGLFARWSKILSRRKERKK